MWRHGDVFLARVEEIPANLPRLPAPVLAEGEITGHAHRIEEAGAAEVYDAGEDRFLRILADRATLIHEEHGPIELERGEYRVWIQREYFPDSIRRVID